MILKLVKQSNPYGDNCSLMEYKDEGNRKILFRDTNSAFEYVLVKGTHPQLNNRKTLNKVATEFVTKGLNQHDFKGGYMEAIQTLKIRL